MRELARRILTALYHREAQYIVLKRIGNQKAGRAALEGGNGAEIECQLVESVEALQTVAQEIAATMPNSVQKLTQRVAQGCLLILAWHLNEAEPRREAIGHMLCERGVFSALGRKGKVSSDILFVHYYEVLPKYRGQRIADVMRGTAEEYCRTHGVTKRCGVVSPTNASSLRSSLRHGFTIVGTVARLSILRGWFVWETPWERIEAALRQEEPRG